MTEETISDIVAMRIREARKALGWQVADLAARCADHGHPELTENVIENIEGGRRDRTGRRRRDVTVDELRVLSDVLGFSPADVLDGLPPGTLGPMSVDELQNVISGLEQAQSFLKWQADRAATQQPIVAAIVTSQNGVLITERRDGKPPWDFVTGECEPGERPEDAAVREVKEETGLEVTTGQRIGERTHPQTGRHMVYLEAKPVRGLRVFVGDEAELSAVKWATPAEALELLPDMFQPVRAYLEQQAR